MRVPGMANRESISLATAVMRAMAASTSARSSRSMRS
jgi:hypothetical protein